MRPARPRPRDLFVGAWLSRGVEAGHAAGAPARLVRIGDEAGLAERVLNAQQRRDIDASNSDGDAVASANTRSARDSPFSTSSTSVCGTPTRSRA
jgi:hypothetical protein